MRKITVAVLLVLGLSVTLAASDENALATAYFSGKGDTKRIALTFDDGPHPQHTAEILDILAEHDIKATFFVIGKLGNEYPELVKREIAEGHEVASHTWSHPNIAALSEEGITNELLETEEFLASLGYKPKLFRPPEGKCGENVLRAAASLDYDVILWTVDTLDWAHTPREKIVNNVLTNTRPGSIILCHDFVAYDSPTPDALREIIPKLKENGYEFVTVSRLLFD